MGGRTRVHMHAKSYYSALTFPRFSSGALASHVLIAYALFNSARIAAMVAL